MGGGLSAYQDALDYLFVRTTGEWRLGLERTLELLAVLGNPHQQLRCIHVAGTNGKGSVCAMLESVLRERGFRIARYTSPHLVSFRERMLVDGAPVAERDVVEFIERWVPEIERIGATFFEATTAMAFHLFARARPDLAIIEVGLGGRLDATNVIDPLVSVVTSIGPDHTEYLGTTLAEIAREKAGIFKPGRAAVIGETNPEIAKLLADVARDVGAGPVSIVTHDVPISRVVVDASGTQFVHGNDGSAPPTRISLIGVHQAQNAATALGVLDSLPAPWRVSPSDAAPGLAGVALPGRFHRVGPVIFDVAHNPDSMRALASTIGLVNPPRPRVAVLCILSDKNWRAMIGTLSAVVDRMVLTVAPTSPAARRWDLAIVHKAAELAHLSCFVEPDFGRALERAHRGAATVIITGSFHTVGDAMSCLHVTPLAE